ncbi:GspH/FimT family protein [Marinomonas sp. 2405UD68-3]|uniref:GspH/FimT family protein n=1 Tax=Marinomonas sp. 2405UD68-3 TaxID=3391835 RepID=UPI0039C9C834
MNKVKGFTLIEVLVVITIVSSVSVFLSSSNAFSLLSNENTLLKAKENLGLSLLRARQLAVNSQTEVILCGGVSCNGNWSQGVSILIQNDVLYSHVFPNDIEVKWKGFPVHKTSVSFLPNGLSSYQNGTFYLCDATFYSYIRLNQSGRFYSSPLLEMQIENTEDILC